MEYTFWLESGCSWKMWNSAMRLTRRISLNKKKQLVFFPAFSNRFDSLNGFKLLSLRSYSTEYFPISAHQNAAIRVSELLKNLRSTDVEALKLWNIRSGMQLLLLGDFGRLFRICFSVCPDNKPWKFLRSKFTLYVRSSYGLGPWK